MKIALITKNFDPVQGGSERYGYNLALALSQMGHEVHVLCHRFAQEKIQNIFHHKLGDKKPLKAKSKEFIQQSHTILKDLSCDIDFAITPCYPVDVYRAGDGVHIHWLQLKYPGRLHRFFATIMPAKKRALKVEKQLYTNGGAKHIIVNSYLVKKHIEKYYAPPSHSIHTIYNGVDITLFKMKNSKSKKILQFHAIKENLFHILFVSNNWKRKGLKTLLLGAAKIVKEKKAHIIIVGKGKKQKWKPLIKKLGMENGITFIPPTKEISMWYQASDVMILPTKYDPFANVCLEALACGTPVITSKENGASEIIDHTNNGYVLSSPKAHLEIEKYLAYMQKENILRNMEKEARKKAEEFTIERNAKETLDVFHMILKK